jgi:glycogen debranching enzyme
MDPRELERRGRILGKKSPAVGRSIADALIMKDGDVFLVTTRSGDIPTQGPHGFGLYHHDCRFLNGYVLTLDGRAPLALVATAADGYRGIVELTNPDLPSPSGGTLDKHEVALRWDRILDGAGRALHDVIHVRSFAVEPVDLVIELEFQAGFEDLFQVRGLLLEQHGTRHPARWVGSELRFRYDGKDGIDRSTRIHFWRAPDQTEDRCARFALHLDPDAEEEIALTLQIAESAPEARDAPGLTRPDLAAIERRRQAALTAAAGQPTEVRAGRVLLQQALTRSRADLAMLRSGLGDDAFYSAGVPWFVALFGRDALVVALESLAYDPGMAADTLRLLARHQATRDDPARDAEPGKILHELRVGELAHLGAIPQTPYYGTVDATPLFLVLLGRHAAWTGSLDLFHALRPAVDAALGWIDAACAADDHGYVAYRSRATGGIANQGWKDSGDAIVMANGDLARQPIALVEVQGYVYLAWTLIADLLERAGEPAPAARLRTRAAALQARFAQDFWLPDPGCLALARTPDGPAAVVTSNAGQALWSGIVDPEQARRTVGCLLSEAMWSGFGIRTLSRDARRFNPVAYHRGTVWPHDNALIVAGLRRYGFDEAACQVFSGILDAAQLFPMRRLPELFAGFDRADYGVVVRYPVACHPQAWAAGALPFMLESLLGLVPEAFEGRLRVVRPILPEGLGPLEVRGLRVGRGVIDLAFERRPDASVTVRELRNEGSVTVSVEPR